MTRYDALPPNLPPRGISRAAAAQYIGVGVTLFDAMVEDGHMPPPKEINGRRVWDVRAIDSFFIALPGDASEKSNPWDSVLP